MKLLTYLSAIAAALFLCSCGDSHKSIMKDQISLMGEVADVLEDAAGGGDIKDAAEKIGELAEEMNSIQSRIKEIGEPEADAEKALEEEFASELEEVMERIQKAMSVLMGSGQDLKPLTDAMSKMNV